jgi:hypothetical protein
MITDPWVAARVSQLDALAGVLGKLKAFAERGMPVFMPGIEPEAIGAGIKFTTLPLPPEGKFYYDHLIVFDADTASQVWGKIAADEYRVGRDVIHDLYQRRARSTGNAI